VISGVLRTGIELLDRKSGETTLINYGEPDFQCQPGLGLLACRAQGKDGPQIVVYDVAKKVVKRWEPKEWSGSPGLHGFSARGLLVGDCLKTTRRDDRTVLVDCLFLWAPPFDRAPVLIECGQAPRCLAVSPDGKHAVLGMDDNRVYLWGLEKGKKERELAAHRRPGRITALAFSADGKRLASVSSRNAHRRYGLTDTGDAELIVHDTANWKEIARAEAHRSPCHLLVFLPDGKRLVTAGRFDGLLRVWSPGLAGKR
jgi:WD40 repeat protein